jgi:hypothetical protein
LAARDVDSFHDVALPGPGEREGFENQDAFMRAHDGTQIGIAKQLDEADKFDPFPADRDELLDRNEENKHQLKAFLAKQDADAKRDMDKVLGDWEDHRQSLQDEVDYQNKMNGVLNAKADRIGEQLVRHTKQTTETAEDVADQEERANEIQLKKFTANLEHRQEDLASQIVGLPDPGEPSEDEKALLKQNIMVSPCLARPACCGVMRVPLVAICSSSFHLALRQPLAIILLYGFVVSVGLPTADDLGLSCVRAE